jgi:hypothetical protein
MLENWIRPRRKEALLAGTNIRQEMYGVFFWSFIALILEIPLSSQSNKATDLCSP